MQKMKEPKHYKHYLVRLVLLVAATIISHSSYVGANRYISTTSECNNCLD